MGKRSVEDENDLNDIAPMTTMQKAIIGLAVVAVIAFIAYTAALISMWARLRRAHVRIERNTNGQAWEARSRSGS